MSIENNLTRIADALEALLGKFDHIGQAVVPATATSPSPAPSTPEVVVPPVAPSPAPVSTPAPVTDATVTTTHTEAPTPPPAVEVPPAPPVAEAPALSKDELNEALVKEFHRLGSRDPIDTVMKKFGVMSLHDLDAKHYATLLKEVQAL